MGVFELPVGYSLVRKIDFLEKKFAREINAGALLILLLLGALGIMIVPLEVRFDGLRPLLLVGFGLLLAILLYVVAHELIHGVFIKKYSGRKAKYGFAGAYAWAGSDAYFNKRQYIVIALAPIVLLGLLLLLLNVLLPQEWFWPVYLIQMLNISGAAGDIYLTGLMGRLPADVLVKDAGLSMEIYARPV